MMCWLSVMRAHRIAGHCDVARFAEGRARQLAFSLIGEGC